MKERLSLVLLVCFVGAVTVFSAWLHYNPDNIGSYEYDEFADEFDHDRRGPSGWRAKMTVPAKRLRGRDLAIAPDMDTRTRKSAFFDALRPIIREENLRIAELRGRLITAHADDETPEWVADVARSYRVKWTGQEWDTLLARVDIVPLTLVMAQAANESSWGRSRFAREGNNLFGMWCFRPGCGIIPARREVGKTHEVAAYNTVNASVRAYLHTINTVNAYKQLRAIRSKLRAAGKRLDGARLAAGLVHYSERGQEYVDEVRAMIRVNRRLMLRESTQG